MTLSFHVRFGSQILDPAQRNNAVAIIVGIRFQASF